jgi:trk system potassium uptake protein TrkH
MIVLMLIGGSPGSTAGGMKTTTFSLCIGTSMSVFKRKNSVGFFGRRIADDTVRCATAILMLYIALFLLSGCAISLIEDLPMSSCLYETASALGTVGITLGITTSLSLPSQIILMCLMFLGRVGGLTLIYAAIYKNKADLTKYPVERIAIG